MSRSYYTNKIKSIRALGDSVLVTEMNFSERVISSGIILVSDDGKNSGIRPRWGRVYAVGPKQRDVRVGQWILVDHGRWTRGIDIEDDNGKQTLRRIDTKDILAVSDVPVTDDTMSDKVV